MGQMIYKSEAMQMMITYVNHIAQYSPNILLEGESGTGKDSIAQYIHSVSRNSNGPFVVVNCASFSAGLIESELFGYVKGAFTGADKEGRKGLIQEADGGTLYLDEINSLPLELQGKLLRVLETKKVRCVGGTKEFNADFQLISASNIKLTSLIKSGQFRLDLFYRINLFTLRIPPLRDRREDIIPLAELFLESFNKQYSEDIEFTDEDKKTLYEYNWPGNIRELKNTVEQYVMTKGGTIKNPTMPSAENRIRNSSNKNGNMIGDTLKNRLAYAEKEIIAESIARNKTKREAARELDITPETLSRKIADYNLKYNSVDFLINS